MTAILAAGGYANNAELIVACRTLGYLDDHTPTWDGTYRHGRFWTLWQPQQLHRTDLDPAHSPDHPGGLDATTTPYPDGHWARIVLDPPYKLNGTSTGQGAATAALKAAGNAVCPQQATAAFGLLTGGKP